MISDSSGSEASVGVKDREAKDIGRMAKWTVDRETDVKQLSMRGVRGRRSAGWNGLNALGSDEGAKPETTAFWGRFGTASGW